MMWKCLLILTLVWYGQMSLVHGHLNKNLANSLFEDLVNMMMKIRGHDHHGRRNVIAFSASMTKQQSLSVKEVIIFDKEWTNIGKGYDHKTGIFTAPRAGVYQFTCTAMTYPSKSLRIHLWHNQLKTYGLYMSGSSYRTGTINMVLNLRKDDTVSIKSTSSSQIIYSDSGLFTTFSGYRL